MDKTRSQEGMMLASTTADGVSSSGPGEQGTEGNEYSGKESQSRLRANIFWLYALQGLNYLIPLVLLPYLVRVLGVSQFGLIAFAQAIAQYFVIATDYGFSFSATRRIATLRNDKDAINRIYWMVMSIKVSFMVLCAGVLLLAIAVFPTMHRHSAIYLAAYITVIGNVIFPQWLFQGLERMRSISIITGVAKVIAAALIFLLVRHRSDLLLAAILQSSGMLVAGLLGTATAARYYIGAPCIPSWSEVLKVLRESGHLFLVSAAVTLYTNTNTFLVGVFAGVEQAGYFSLADRLTRAILGLLNPVMQAAYPHTVLLIKQSRDCAIRFIRRLLAIFSGVAILGSVVLYTLAWPVAELVFKAQAAPVVPILRALSVFLIFATLSYILGVQVLIPFGFDSKQSRLLLVGGVLNLICGSLLIAHIGALGAVISMTITEAFLVVGSLYVLHRGEVKLFKKGQAT